MDDSSDLLVPARQLLAGITLAGYLATQPPRTVVCISARYPVVQVLRRFAAARLVAAPCFADEQLTQYVGFLDLMDVVTAVVEAARAGPPGGAPGSPRGGSGASGALRHHAAAAARQVAAQPVAAIKALSNDAQLVYQAQLRSSLLEVVQQGFAHPADHLACHRLAVLQPANSDAAPAGAAGAAAAATAGRLAGGNGEESMAGSSADLAAVAADEGTSLQLTHIVSQSDILRFLHKHAAQLGHPLLSSTLRQLGFREKHVLCVPADLSVMEALAGMVDSHVAAVAVIDSPDSSVLIGSLSISDLRGLGPSLSERLAEPVGEFLRGGGWCGGRAGGRQNGSPRGGVAAEFGVRSPESLPHGAPPPVCCTLGATFGEVLSSLATQRLHRLFVVDGEGRAVGVVSITDLLRFIAGS
ncbi:E3 ubiquitin-ligase [Micractinium conductrix]|uniref:E3 ubiquitin-ligase n=1 Tax=Micractinium conductrix TaxID=554055 RepID=A0A2P6VMP6_9CHLO|nr:E3 ubiquitin-ligase [Micractinium conductrix]|eukprot:PSC75368.1 E3 ubiquitin-ligase [Micractinium conductrix]